MNTEEAIYEEELRHPARQFQRNQWKYYKNLREKSETNHLSSARTTYLKRLEHDAKKQYEQTKEN